ncbi:hypothetical protein B4135_3114 [Caldibacillus debilis]|uniref:Uncharacterized protein n=1 Tax=Caldibacillus debilis TaxID=301148 RepID=A0A150LIX3_9BACI|nr:hypothetical protein B4135_3114 [Caldibacillus debilis]
MVRNSNDFTHDVTYPERNYSASILSRNIKKKPPIPQKSQAQKKRKKRRT